MSYIDTTKGPHTHAILYMSIENTELLHKYKDAIQSHNVSSLNDVHPNAGFDLYFPKTMVFDSVSSTMASMDVKCEMEIYNEIENKWHSSGYYMYPRSSISKTPLMLANGTGIIDSGYRGNLMGAFDNISRIGTTFNGGEWYQEQNAYDRLLQICMPDLSPFKVEIVTDLDDTTRGAGGLGSTGF